MNNALEPLPTKQLVAVKNKRPKAVVKVEAEHRSSQGNVYPWLLGASTCLSVVLCWMYVTKPVIAASVDFTGDEAISTDHNLVTSMNTDTGSANLLLPTSEPGDEDTSPNASVEGLMPSSESLPGSSASEGANVSKDIDLTKAASPSPVDKLMESGWEKTNHKVQHALQADFGSGDVESILIDVPVFYQSRTMRWSPDDIKTARGLLSRLLIYEANINKLKLEGEAILIEWNGLLEKTLPNSSLRADSLSLPYNHSSLATEAPLSGSESLIKVDQ